MDCPKGQFLVHCLPRGRAVRVLLTAGQRTGAGPVGPQTEECGGEGAGALRPSEPRPEGGMGDGNPFDMSHAILCTKCDCEDTQNNAAVKRHSYK
jgi:hypothetical protein